jgi:hypothetical protein
MRAQLRRPFSMAWSKRHDCLSVPHILTSDPPRYERHFNSTDDPFAALYNLANARTGRTPLEI